jgi:hypothetical protein
LTTRFLYRASLAAFVATLAYTYLLSRVLPHELASPLGMLRTPIIALELARSRLDLLAVLGTSDDPGRPSRIAAMLRGHELDSGYLVVYNLFLGLLLCAVARERSSRLLQFALALPFCAAAADAWENVVLVALLGTLDHPEPLLKTLAVATWCKWGALAIATSAAGAGVFAARHRALGALALLPLLTTPLAYVDPHLLGDLVSLGLAVAWLALAAHAASRARTAT